MCTHEGELTVTKALGNALSPEQEANSSALVVTRSTGFLLQGPSFETPGVSAYNLINAEYWMFEFCTPILLLLMISLLAEASKHRF
ncbi:MAG: hypothetical protein MKZ95_11245 [Pirellulales bacterium]|jgi:hypothetical protein|nr:hypothetical protein [Pirellulales bacterium]|mmetsp:Transcript_9456/g.27740  ORF Transcript_9456/g.27740 Transcript_9456/m.27740 type:complete len:86 (-) Transcript_9456:1701-1958(-)